VSSTADDLDSMMSRRAARDLGWNLEMAITWREFLEQYPYHVQEMIEAYRAVRADSVD
jgi:hypothetical protein